MSASTASGTILGPAEVARLLGVEVKTVWVWYSTRKIMPAPDHGVISRVPLWERDTIAAWAAATGRTVVA